MNKLKAAILILGVVFALSLILTVLGILNSAKQFIYNLSQMEYDDAYSIVKNDIIEVLPDLPPQYAASITDETIRTELDRYLADAEALSAWEMAIYTLRSSTQSGTISQVVMWNSVILLILLIWYALWDARGERWHEKEIRDQD